MHSLFAAAHSSAWQRSSSAEDYCGYNTRSIALSLLNSSISRFRQVRHSQTTAAITEFTGWGKAWCSPAAGGCCCKWPRKRWGGSSGVKVASVRTLSTPPGPSFLYLDDMSLIPDTKQGPRPETLAAVSIASARRERFFNMLVFLKFAKFDCSTKPACEVVRAP